MRTKLILGTFLLVSIGNLVGQVIESSELIKYTKPVLMPLLLFFIYESSKGRVTKRILLLSSAVLLSWLGDLALMNTGSTSFLAGIGLFLLAHVLYIFVLFQSSFDKPGFELMKVLPFVIYAAGLFALLIPGAGDFQAPIFVYGIVISVMASMARLRIGKTSQESYRLSLIGAVLFLASDSILATNKFYEEIPLAGLWIMGTYIAAQYFLVSGLLKHPE